MRLFMPLLAVPVLALGLLAGEAVTPAAYGPQAKENQLTAAGFKKRPIKTEAPLADFRQISAHMIRPSTYKGRPVYVYADPTICGCLYFGGTGHSPARPSLCGGIAGGHGLSPRCWPGGRTSRHVRHVLSTDRFALLTRAIRRRRLAIASVTME